MIYISITLIIAVGAILWRYIHKLSSQYSQQTLAMLEIASIIEELAKHQKEFGETIEKEMGLLYGTGVQFYNFAAPRIDFIAMGIQYSLVCLKPAIESALEKAIKNENYEEAKEWRNIRKQVDMIIQYQFKKPAEQQESEQKQNN